MNLVFSDGSEVLVSAGAGAFLSSAWLDPGALLNFSSSDPASLDFGGPKGGVVNLRDNSAGGSAPPVTLTARSACDPSAAALASSASEGAAQRAFGNLVPAPHDVDLGRAEGAPLGKDGGLGVGDELEVSVRIQSRGGEGGDITIFQVVGPKIFFLAPQA